MGQTRNRLGLLAVFCADLRRASHSSHILSNAFELQKPGLQGPSCVPRLALEYLIVVPGAIFSSGPCTNCIKQSPLDAKR